jgi:hypothetical protein
VFLPAAAPAQISQLTPDVVPQPEAPPTIFAGQLTKTDPLDKIQQQSHCKVHEVQLQAGKAYSISLASDQFRPHVRFEDAQGRRLASADKPQAWLVVMIRKAGTYRLVVTSAERNQRGAYWLVLRRYAQGGAAQRRFDLERHAIALN